jgi:two-component sensor histidine kinase
MLARHRSAATRAFVSAKPALAGEWPAGGGVRVRPGGHGAGGVPGIAEIVGRRKTAAPHQATSTARAGGVAVPSFILRAVQIFRGHPAIGYATAIASIGIATVLQWLARDVYQGVPFLTIYPAIVLTAFVGGYRAGLLSALLAGLSQWCLFIPDYNVFAVVSFALDATLCVFLIEYINRSLENETQAKEHQALLKDELHHRMHNLFAVIQSVIRFSLPKDNAPVSLSVIEDRLFGRLQAMFDANSYVSDSIGNVALLDLIRGQIRGLDQRIVIRGRPHLMLCPKMTQNFSLIMHELVTNSLKYGALSASDGRVLINLKETPGGVTFDWNEVDGPPVKAPADEDDCGFGSHILGRFARGFCTDVRISYAPSGFSYALRIPRDRRT